MRVLTGLYVLWASFFGLSTSLAQTAPVVTDAFSYVPYKTCQTHPEATEAKLCAALGDELYVKVDNLEQLWKDACAPSKEDCQRHEVALFINEGRDQRPACLRLQPQR